MSDRTLLLDISRTVARARLMAPTGIDRVERAYIQWALERDARFLAAFDGRQHLLGPEPVVELVGWLDGERDPPGLDMSGRVRLQRPVRLRQAQSLVRRSAIDTAQDAGAGDLLRRQHPQGGIYLNTGHDNLSPGLLAEIRSAGFYQAVMLHDLIPLDHPEFAREGTTEKFHQKFLAALGADLLILNSHHTARRARAHAPSGLPRAVIVPLGIEMPVVSAEPGHGTFVCLGTIEPRKNHRMLLALWGRMWEARGQASPMLHIIGRRGWANEDVFRILDSHPMVGQSVIVHDSPRDLDVRKLIASATALLFPTFAEGFGLPLAEALALGCPVLASDLPALREIGGHVPEWLDPNCSEDWQAAIDAYAMRDSQQRSAQCARMVNWQKPTWAAHFQAVENALETILVQAHRGG